jgi:pimeloyl-ACP methyl ester carboxylesterase
MARSARELWALHDLLQPVRALADGWHLVAAAGHFPQIEQREEVLRLIGSFVDRP